jgi:GABA(A) receptor-associated protein
MIGFKNKYPFKQRKIDSENILSKYPHRIPIICEKHPYSRSAPDIDKHKYLVGYDLTVGQFMSVIRKRMSLKPEVAIYIFINGSIHPNSSFLHYLFLDYKDDDGFLYINYDVENTFGNNDFKKGDIIHLIKDNKLDKNNSYIIHYIEIVKGGNWHDGYDETHYGYLENIKTNLCERKMIVFLNLMCQIQNFYAIKV